MQALMPSIWKSPNSGHVVDTARLSNWEWKKYYGFDWQPQHESPNNTYLSNKLKYQLYYHALKEVFTYAKEYGRSKGMNVRCYVPTHSLLNYSQWMIVSPEASLASLDCVDGYIAQVWTGTSREPISTAVSKKNGCSKLPSSNMVPWNQ